MANILVAEDDRAVRTALQALLSKAGHFVTVVSDGHAALSAYANARPDLILLDVMMPRMNGYTVLAEIRKSDPLTPVVFLSAKGAKDDVVLGLSLGSDDYVAKPFDADVLLARVDAALRRGACGAARGPAAESFTFAGTTVDARRMVIVRADGVEEPITQTDLSLIRRLAACPGQVVRRLELAAAAPATSHTLDQRISLLRKKLGPVAAVRLETVYNTGYRYVPVS